MYIVASGVHYPYRIAASSAAREGGSEEPLGDEALEDILPTRKGKSYGKWRGKGEKG